MRWRDEVDVMGTRVLKAQHLRCKLIRSQSPGMALLELLADLEVLAIHTAKIASGEEDGP
jgi:hypothetical protein